MLSKYFAITENNKKSKMWIKGVWVFSLLYICKSKSVFMCALTLEYWLEKRVQNKWIIHQFWAIFWNIYTTKV